MTKDSTSEQILKELSINIAHHLQTIREYHKKHHIKWFAEWLFMKEK